MPTESADPRVVRSIAVTAGDVLAAYEANRDSGPPTVLRVTQPFSGMMRARLHRVVAGDGPQTSGFDENASDAPAAILVRPAELLSEDVPPYPHPDETEDDLRADPAVEYSVDRHHERHQGAVQRWREHARKRLVDSITVETPDGPHRIEVAVLGSRT